MARKFALILGTLGSPRDRFCGGYKDKPRPEDMLRQAISIPHLGGIELVGTLDIRTENVAEMKKILQDNNLICVAINPDVFSDKIYAKGSLSSKDAQVRRAALDYLRGMCDIAVEMNCDLINLWPGQDGYDYLLTADYESERRWLCDSVAQLAQTYPNLRIALEYKPKEPRTHSYLARMADTLLVAIETNCDNVGVTLDTGHAFVAGEVVAEAVVIAKSAGNRLFHMHFNDNFDYWDDDMIVGSVHSVSFIETLYWLDRCGYDGWLCMDQCPFREDAAKAIGESILWLRHFDEIVCQNRSELDELISLGDPAVTSAFLRKMIFPSTVTADTPN